MYVLGIDGGGTKTAAVVTDENGTVYIKAEAGRSNPNTLSKDEFELVMGNLFRQLRSLDDVVFSQIRVCFAGMAGVRESNRKSEVEQLLSKFLPPGTAIFIENDAVNALYSGTLGKPGIVQISGTGSITIGMDETGKIERVGGWGYLFDDVGSGFDLANHALKAVFREYDGRGESTALTHRLLESFKVRTVPDLIEKIYTGEHPRSIISPLSKLVVETAQSGDSVAQTIIDRACSEMAQSINACYTKIFERNERVIVVLSGGVFQNYELFKRKLESETVNSLPNLIYQPTVISPVGGAVVAGLSRSGNSVGDEFVAQFNGGVGV